jgi:hypothetical protein
LGSTCWRVFDLLACFPALTVTHSHFLSWGLDQGGFVHTFIRSYLHTFIPSYTLIHSYTHTHTHTHTLTHSLTHTHFHSLPLVHLLEPCLIHFPSSIIPSLLILFSLPDWNCHFCLDFHHLTIHHSLAIDHSPFTIHHSPFTIHPSPLAVAGSSRVIHLIFHSSLPHLLIKHLTHLNSLNHCATIIQDNTIQHHNSIQLNPIQYNTIQSITIHLNPSQYNSIQIPSSATAETFHGLDAMHPGPLCI